MPVRAVRRPIRGPRDIALVNVRTGRVEARTTPAKAAAAARARNAADARKKRRRESRRRSSSR